jgi:SAM-dependent methyltransferase
MSWQGLWGPFRQLRGTGRRLFRGRSRLVVPEQFNRNSSTVSSLMTPEQSGLWLLERLKQRLSIRTFARTHLLDFGCGVRFTQALINGKVRIGSYTGVDCFADMVHFLRSAVPDPRFTYYVFDAFHPLYNPAGLPLTPMTRLPVPKRDFDLITMFSVITHQYPQDSESIFTILRRHVAPDGRLFFTCFLDPQVSTFEDRSQERNGGRCFYGPDYLTSLVERCGWKVLSTAPAEAPLIGDSFLLGPS